MPSLEHEELVELFTRDPETAVGLLRASGKITIPEYDQIEVVPAELRELVATTVLVDVVILLRQKKPVLILLVEVQLARDEDKLYTWPYYITGLRLRYRCPACLLVYTLDDTVASWCSQTIETGQPGNSFVPVVVGPKNVPRIVSKEEAKQRPYLAVLSALAHGHEPENEEIAKAAWAGIEPLSEDERRLWLQILWMGLNVAAKKALEEAMNLDAIKEQLPLYQEGRDRGKVDALRKAIEGTADLLQLPMTAEQLARISAMDVLELEAFLGKLQGEQGRSLGIEAAEERAEFREARKALRRVLTKRGFTLSDEQQAVIDSCQNLALLERWHDEAITASTVEQALHADSTGQGSQLPQPVQIAPKSASFAERFLQ